jgi:hypothetical protein
VRGREVALGGRWRKSGSFEVAVGGPANGGGGRQRLDDLQRVCRGGGRLGGSKGDGTLGAAVARHARLGGAADGRVAPGILILLPRSSAMSPQRQLKRLRRNVVAKIRLTRPG